VPRALGRSLAVMLAVATAVLLIQLGRQDPRPLSPLLYVRALIIGALFHAGLFWSSEARRGWQRVIVAAAMLPSVLILGGILGEAVTRVSRGVAPRVLPLATAVVGLAAYALAIAALVRRRDWKESDHHVRR